MLTDVLLTRATLLTVAQATEALQMRESDARAWLDQIGAIRTFNGRTRVVWGDVLDAGHRDVAPKVSSRKAARRIPSIAEIKRR